VILIGNGILTLLERPHQLAMLRAERARITEFVEEILRFEPPMHAAPPRYAAEQIELAGVTIAPGETMSVALFAANHDPRRFDHADEFDRLVPRTRTLPSVLARRWQSSKDASRYPACLPVSPAAPSRTT
jgi:cytochrome P450